MINFRTFNTNVPQQVIEQALQPATLDILESYIKFNKKIDLREAKVVSPEKDTSHIRQSEVMWIPSDNKELQPVYNELINILLKVNHYYNFNIHTLETLQYAEYGIDGHFTWHCDGNYKSNENYNRKLSFSLLLSDDYEGGDLEFFYQQEPVKVPLKKNDMVFFPSNLLHRVTPVTRGLRKSVVGWIGGPDFV